MASNLSNVTPMPLSHTLWVTNSISHCTIHRYISGAPKNQRKLKKVYAFQINLN